MDQTSLFMSWSKQVREAGASSGCDHFDVRNSHNRTKFVPSQERSIDDVMHEEFLASEEREGKMAADGPAVLYDYYEFAVEVDLDLRVAKLLCQLVLYEMTDQRLIGTSWV